MGKGGTEDLGKSEGQELEADEHIFVGITEQQRRWDGRLWSEMRSSEDKCSWFQKRTWESSHVVEWTEQPQKQRRRRNYMAAGQVSGEAVEFTKEDWRSVWQLQVPKSSVSAKKHPGVHNRWEWADQAPQLKEESFQRGCGGWWT